MIGAVLERQPSTKVTDEQTIYKAINEARDFFIKQPYKGDGRQAFTVDFNVQVYRALARFRGKEGYEQSKDQLSEGTFREIKTLLGERFNVLLSKRKDRIVENHICPSNSKEPYINILKRGRDYRKKYGNPIDHSREQAEVDGFEKIEKTLTSSDTPVGTMLISVSPAGDEGSIYTHNFYDIFTLKEEDGKRYLESRRYSSALSAGETVKRLGQKLKNQPLPFTNAVSLLSNPILISKESELSTPEGIHKFLHQGHSFMKEKDFEDILAECLPFINAYNQQLCDDPYDLGKINLCFDAILNKADDAANNIENRKKGKDYVVYNVKNFLPIADQINYYGKQEVRKVSSGCGISGGSSSQSSLQTSLERINKSYFSVSEFGNSDEYGELEFPCPSCGNTNTRTIGKLITNCQHCGSGRVGCKEEKRPAKIIDISAKKNLKKAA